jgi:hypothetical protein
VDSVDVVVGSSVEVVVDSVVDVVGSSVEVVVGSSVVDVVVSVDDVVVSGTPPRAGAARSQVPATSERRRARIIGRGVRAP